MPGGIAPGAEAAIELLGEEAAVAVEPPFRFDEAEKEEAGDLDQRPRAALVGGDAGGERVHSVRNQLVQEAEGAAAGGVKVDGVAKGQRLFEQGGGGAAGGIGEPQQGEGVEGGKGKCRGAHRIDGDGDEAPLVCGVVGEEDADLPAAREPAGEGREVASGGAQAPDRQAGEGANFGQRARGLGGDRDDAGCAAQAVDQGGVRGNGIG